MLDKKFKLIIAVLMLKALVDQSRCRVNGCGACCFYAKGVG